MYSWIRISMLGVATIAGAGCATAGTRPHDMSAAQHERAAAAADDEATEHASRFDPAQTTSVRQRAGWGEANPTAEHRHEADKLRAEAAKHRAAAQALRDAEARSCGAVPADDRDLGPFFHREDVERVEPFYANTGRNRTLRGATITYKPVAGLTAEAMQRNIDCHLARNAALGFDAPEMAHCPLASRGVQATARDSRGRVVVEVSANDPSVANALLARAKLLERR
jgi:hypothetical protein